MVRLFVFIGIAAALFLALYFAYYRRIIKKKDMQ